jgi:hypothetical protein
MTVVLFPACTSAENVLTIPIPQDPSKEGVLIGVTEVEGMIIQLEMEPAKAM